MGVSYDCAHVRLISALCMSLVFITVLFVSFFVHKCESFITRAIEDASSDRMLCPVCPMQTMFCFSCGRAWEKSSPDGISCGHSDCSNVTRFKILEEALLKVSIFREPDANKRYFGTYVTCFCACMIASYLFPHCCCFLIYYVTEGFNVYVSSLPQILIRL